MACVVAITLSPHRIRFCAPLFAACYTPKSTAAAAKPASRIHADSGLPSAAPCDDFDDNGGREHDSKMLLDLRGALLEREG
jgi:hypothetical protein